MLDNTKLPTKIEKAVVSAFRLNELRAGSHDIRNETGKVVDTFRVDGICIIQLINYYTKPVTIALTHQYGWSANIKDESEFTHECKGLLLIPATLDQDFGAINSLHTIDMSWPIPVLTCLGNMNVCPDRPYPFATGGLNHEYVIHIYTHTGYSCLSYFGMYQGKNMDEFYDALITTIKQMAKAIDDNEISSLIDRGQPASW
jgi:hypothetical protein